MKLILIMGALAFFALIVSSVNAAGFDLSNCEVAGSTSIEKVTATYGGNTIIVSLTDLTSAVGRMDKVGFVLSPFTSATVKDNLGQTWQAKGYKQMDGFGRYYEYDSPGSSATSVTITFSDTISGIPNLAAHVAWGTGSSFFAGSGATSIPIPEFPTLVLPVAVVLGILVILNSRGRQ